MRIPLTVRVESAVDRADIQALMYGPVVLTATSASTSYLKVSLADRLDLGGDVSRGISKTPANVFAIGSLSYEPAYNGRDVAYHMYFQRNEPTVTFADDGTLALVTGCNNATGEWEIDGHELTIETGARTMMACDDPPGVTEQENALVAALDATARLEIAPGSLTLLDDEGRIVLVAVQE